MHLIMLFDLIGLGQIITPQLVALLLLAGALSLLIIYPAVHRGLHYCYLCHAKRFCRENNLILNGWKCSPAFDDTGLKTEFTLVELDCLDDQMNRRLVRLSISLLGIHKVVANEVFPSQSPKG